MYLSKKRAQEFKDLAKEALGLELTEDEAYSQASQLVGLLETIVKILEEEQG